MHIILPVLLSGVVVGAVAPVGLPAQDERAYEVLEAAAERYWGLETLCARFHQEIEVTLLGETRSGRGTICQRQPSEFSMRFSDPEGDLVVVDGEFLWTFYPSMDAKQVLRFAAKGAEGRFNFFKNLLDWLCQERDLLALQNKRPTDRAMKFAVRNEAQQETQDEFGRRVRNRQFLLRGLNLYGPALLLFLVGMAVFFRRRGQKRTFLADQY